MDLDKLLKVLNERQSVNEMPFGRGVEQADTEAAAKTPEELAKLKAKHKAERAEHKAEGDHSTSVGYAKRKGSQEAGDPKGLEKTRSKSQNSSTEYEGPFLDETTKKRIETVAKGMIAQSAKTAEEEKKVPGTTKYGEGHAAGEHVSKKTDIERRAARLIGRKEVRSKRKRFSRAPVKSGVVGRKELGDSTEYEGPSLAEQVDFIKTFLEGKTTGADPYATGQRMGSFVRRMEKGADLGVVSRKKVQQKKDQSVRIKRKMQSRWVARASKMKDGPSPEKVVKHVGDQTADGYYHGKKNSEYSRGRGAGAENSSTEYEGPSLEEGIQRLMRQAAAAKKKETKDLDAGKFSRGEKARKKTETPLNQRIAQNVKDADARAKAKGRSATGTTKAIVKSGDVPKSTTATLKSDAGEVGKRAVTAKKTIARRKWREKEYGKENASTQYEGPSLSEQSEFIKTFLEGHKEEREKREARRFSQEIGSKKHSRWSDEQRTKNPESYHGTGDRARTGIRGSTPGDSTLRRRRSRKASLAWKKKENSSTEYEGPSLAEQSEFIKTFLEEGKYTGNWTKTRADAVAEKEKRQRLGREREEAEREPDTPWRIARAAEKASKKKKSQKDWTEYEGPSLAEQSEFIKTFLEDLDEGKFGDFVSKHKKKLGTAAAGVALAGSMALGGGGDKQKSTKQVKEPTPITKTIDHSDDADYKGAPGTQNKGNWRTAAYGEKGTKYRDTVDKVDRLGGASKAEDDETDRRRGKKPGEIGSKSNELVKRARTSILNRTAKTSKK